MAINRYFTRSNASEQNLRESLLVEAIKIYGHDVYYLPRKIVNLDTIKNEVIESKFSSAFRIEVYLKNVDTFEGDGEFLSKFGLETRNQIQLEVTRKRWKEMVGRFRVTEQNIRPAEGDLIYFPMMKALFEIKYATDDRSAYYQLANLPIFNLTCELFEYSSEKLDTNITDIDQIESNLAQRIALTLGAGTGKYELREPVTQTLGNGVIIRGEIATYDNNKLGITQTVASDGGTALWRISNSVSNNGNIIGTRTGASYAITAISTIDDLENFDRAAQNKTFETSGNEIVDFTEMNPFGEINRIQ